MVLHITRKWGEFSVIGKVSPHHLRRTAITRALDKGLRYRSVQMMSDHKDPKKVLRYDHGEENLEQNAKTFSIMIDLCKSENWNNIEKILKINSFPLTKSFAWFHRQ